MQKLTDAKMEIHKPSAAEMKVWRSVGEGPWNTVSKDVDRRFIDDLIALRRRTHGSGAPLGPKLPPEERGTPRRRGAAS